VVLALLLAASLQAQNPPPDSLRPPRDTTRRDSTALPDSLKPDSMEPVLPPLGTPPGPQPALRRMVFDDDFIRASGVMSLGELLEHVPGVFLVRAGWFGHPEAVAYAGQGATSLELYWDGFALDPLGQDSAGFDLGRFDLGSLKRVEVEVLPTVLRVYLISDVRGARRAHTEASFGTGDASTNGYRLRYMNRWAGGGGLGVGATAFSTAGTGTSRAGANQLNLAARGTWAPSERSGVEFQLNTYSFTRDELDPSAFGATSAPFPAVSVRRTDMFARAFAASRDDGMGLRLDAQLGSSSYHDTSVTRDTTVTQAMLDVSYRARNWSAEGWTRVRDSRTPLEMGERLAWSPLRMLTLTGFSRVRTLLGGGGTSELSGGADLRPVNFLQFHGDVRWRHLDDSAYVASDTAQNVRDWSAGVSVFSERVTFDASIGHRDPYSVPALGQFRAQLPGVVAVGSRVTTVSYEIRPYRWFTISGWWRDPGVDSVPFEPRNHAITRFTFRSAFLPKFRRNVFDMMAQVEIESWGRGVSGRDSTGTLYPLGGYTVWNYHFQFKLVGAVIYWTMRNALFKRYTLIPGYELPRGTSRFGVRWEFTN
ncbi:MAG: TonB-dependent receptor, partial [Gemmatimonadales bacterium]